jgi:hypothetical protein
MAVGGIYNLPDAAGRGSWSTSAKENSWRSNASSGWWSISRSSVRWLGCCGRWCRWLSNVLSVRRGNKSWVILEYKKE